VTDHLDFLTIIQREGAAFVDACERADAAAVVAGCPDWTVRDLLWHLTDVNDLWRATVGERLSSPRDRARPERPADELLGTTYRAGLERVLDVLRAADPAAPTWSWVPDATTAWVVRRLAHETTVHRWDAQLAAGDDPVIDAELASDGIDEFLFEMLGRVSPDAAAAGGSVHLHCTDVDGEWTIRPQDDGTLLVAREHAKGDAAIRGPASDLLLVLWRRLPSAAVEVIGDAEVADRFVAGRAQ
jgi:uncharacterized protein (TIGR03083 family)